MAVINVELLMQDLEDAGIFNVWYDSEGGRTADNASPAQLQQADAIRAAHNPAALSRQQRRLVALRDYLDSRIDDLKYAEYFFVLQKKLLDLWRTRPNLTDTTAAVISAAQGNRATDPNHLAMWNTFCWKVNIDFGIPVTSGELPASPTAAQARQIIQCAYDFSNTGIVMANMILLNQRL